MEAVLSIAGSDSSGGAGIQADIKTIAACGLFAETAITALTAQNTLGVRGVENVDAGFVEQQIDAVFDDIRPAAVKVGMVSSAAIVEAIARALVRNHACNVVVDPVMVATSGSALIADAAVEALVRCLFPLADVVTPNLPEASALSGLSLASEADMERAADSIAATCKGAVLVKGGHGWDADDAGGLVPGAGEHAGGAAGPAGGGASASFALAGAGIHSATCFADGAGDVAFVSASDAGSSDAGESTHGSADDLLRLRDGTRVWLRAPRIDTHNTHGTGCTLSSAIACGLARGLSVEQAVREAKAYVRGALAAGLDLGQGSGPLDHMWQHRAS